MAAPTIIGAPISLGAADGGNVTLDLTTFGAAVNTDDVIAVFGCNTRAGTGGGTSSSGWSTPDVQDQSTTRLEFFWKKMGGTPDTSFVYNGTGNAQDAVSAIAYCLRGVDTTTALDATTTKTGANSTNPDAPAIVTITNDALVIAACASSASDASVTAPSGYSNAISLRTVDTRPITQAAATIVKATAGSEDPPSWTAFLTGNWAAMSVALRPVTGGGSTFNESVAETGSVAETQTGLGVFEKSLAEVITVAETQIGTGVFEKSLAETITVVDALTGGLMQTGAAAEILTAVETQSVLKTSVGDTAEVLAAAETQAGLGVFGESLAEVLAAVETSSGSIPSFNTVRARAMIVG